MMSLAFSPLLPWPLFWTLTAIAFVVALMVLWSRMRGAVLRAAALALLPLALANPSIISQEREPLTTIAAIVVDRSQSQLTPERIRQTDEALAALQARLAKYPGIEPRTIEIRNNADSDTPATRGFEALTAALADLPPSRIGGAVFISDGQLHDIPASGEFSSFSAPIHALITGNEEEFDRRVEVVKAPRFGVVNEPQNLTFRVVDDGKSPGGDAFVTIRLNGQPIGQIRTEPGRDTNLEFRLDKGGSNILEFEVDMLAGEVTTANNAAVHVIDGIRQNLRVLLVSGAPHAGERAWRNLLKSDASVDLVHFTILRPPEKQDGTPINELSLIAFPTHELFVEKINDFDLIIFDRYQHRGVLPILYYDYIVDYVRGGGAVLLAAGPEHAGRDSISLTPLSQILPAEPTGIINEAAFYPRLSELGKKHPLTRGLAGSDSEPPRWGRWFRSIDVNTPTGQTVMQDADGNPLLVLSREGEGRVAMLLSDQGWLWSRGFEGGGPHVALYRRIAHWLMKEPSLEEEALTARSTGNKVEITRQTIGDAPGPATVTMPSGETSEVVLQESEPGLYRARIDTSETGLFHIANGDLSALVHVGAVDAPEFAAAISTTESLKEIADNTHGVVARLADGDGIRLPQILPVRGQVRIENNSRMIFRLTDETALKGINTVPLFAGLLGLIALLFAITTMWWREGR